MRENQLITGLETYHDQSPFELTADKFSEYKKKVGNLVMAIKSFEDNLDQGSMTVGYRTTICSCIEMYTQELTGFLGYQGVLEQQQEERSREIRGLNEQNRELRRQLGEKVSLEDVREKVKNMVRQFTQWWNVNGSGHSSDGRLFEWGFQARISGMFSVSYYSEGDYPSKEEKVATFKAAGWDVAKDADWLLCTDNNLRRIVELISSRYPSAKIREVKSFFGRVQEPQLRDVEIDISNLDDFNEPENNKQ